MIIKKSTNKIYLGIKKKKKIYIYFWKVIRYTYFVFETIRYLIKAAFHQKKIKAANI